MSLRLSILLVATIATAGLGCSCEPPSMPDAGASGGIDAGDDPSDSDAGQTVDAGRPIGTLAVALTFDDLPFGSGIHGGEFLSDVTARLLGHLQDHDAEATGFVNEGKMYSDGSPAAEQTAVLTQWLNAGMNLGNHTRTHPSYDDLDPATYFNDISDGEALTTAALDEYSMPLEYFRHPFLRTGDTPDKKQQLESFLTTEGYITAPVTLSNQDWMYSIAYDRAQNEGDEGMQQMLGAAYVDHMEEMFAYTEELSQKLFDRDINQVLLLHANSLNADYLGAAMARLTDRGYRFTSLDEALTDPAYDSPNDYVGATGISWLERWGITQGESGDFFAGKPEVPQFVRDYAGF